jgi:hypothetical protein
MMGHVELDARRSSKLYEITIPRRPIYWRAGLGVLVKLARHFSIQPIA